MPRGILADAGLCSPPFPIPVRRVSRNPVHLYGGEKLVELGMGVSEKHDHPVLAPVVVPDVAPMGHIPVRMPNPVALNDFRRRLYRDLGVFDRDV